MSAITLASIAVWCLLVSACAPLSPKPAEGPLFQGVDSPAPGQALLYVFRPGFTEHRGAERPMVYVDGAAPFPMAWRGYKKLVVSPGMHSIEVRPENGARDDWQMQLSVSVDADQRYFVAIWHAAVGTPVSQTGVIPTGGGLLAFPMHFTQYRDRGTHIELVQESDALPAIGACRLISQSQ